MKKPLSMEVAYCYRENRPCVDWVEKYFQDCLCNLKDDFSFAFGLISLVCWGVAEIPQIITNFRTKSGHGVSLAFLLTWVAGDVFNLVGCFLEPATLPTQLYTALLYTISTLVLVFQSVYYDHIRRWWKCPQGNVNNDHRDEEDKEPLRPTWDHSETPTPSVPVKASPRRDFYYTSARSMAGSATPPYRSHLWTARSGPSTLGIDVDSSSDDESAPISYKRSVSKPMPIPRSAGYGTILATSVNLPIQTKALMVQTGLTGRKLLLENNMEHNVLGQWLGWLMAVIYMGGRLPQIYLNIERGNVEGLNPLMFVFALLANVTYVASILVRSTEWDRIKANMPWLLDAVVCVGLDLFIILQYIYYRYVRKKIESHADNYGYYTEPNKS